MITAFDGPRPSTYLLRVDGHLDQHWAAWFGGLVLTHDEDGMTTLSAVVVDQAELHGLLTRIRDLGVTLISLSIANPTAGTP